MSVRRGPTDVLLVTATSTETRAILAASHKADLPPVTTGEINVYWDLGRVAKATISLLQTEMGAGGQGGAINAVADAIAELGTRAVVAVGLAFGLKPNEQKLGQVLVSQQMIDYAPQRVGSNADKVALVARGVHAEASPRLLQRFNAGAVTWKAAEVSFGPLLSGPFLIDNEQLRDLLVAQFPKAIGGEMEGARHLCRRGKKSE